MNKDQINTNQNIIHNTIERKGFKVGDSHKKYRDLSDKATRDYCNRLNIGYDSGLS